jgi:general secretion pathway protein J
VRTRRTNAGFTLIELVVAMALLAIMMTLLYSGLTFALRSWDAGASNGERVVDRLIGENFLRRELAQMFPMRWKNPMVLSFAFDGQTDSLRFTSSRPPGMTQGGLSLVGLAVEPDEKTRSRNLVMRRAMPDDDAKDFGPLDSGERTVLLTGVDRVEFAYFGADNDFAEPTWRDKWALPSRMPQVIRIRAHLLDGEMLPDMTVRLMVGEEAGCLESFFQRGCLARRR